MGDLDDNEYGQDDEFDENDEAKRSRMAANAVNTYFYRHHYLSIIQEEEEHSANDATPPSSRSNSRPSSIYALNPVAIQKAYKEYKVSTYNIFLKYCRPLYREISIVIFCYNILFIII